MNFITDFRLYTVAQNEFQGAWIFSNTHSIVPLVKVDPRYRELSTAERSDPFPSPPLPRSHPVDAIALKRLSPNYFQQVYTHEAFACIKLMRFFYSQTNVAEAMQRQ